MCGTTCKCKTNAVNGKEASGSTNVFHPSDVLDVFNVIEGKDGGQDRWVKVGNAYMNKDGSINAYLDVFPRDGKLQIRNRRTTDANRS